MVAEGDVDGGVGSEGSPRGRHADLFLLRYCFVRNFRAAAFFIATCAVLGAQEQLSAPVEELLSTLSKYNGEGKPAAQRVAFELPDAVLNAYLASALKQRPRPGIDSASVKLLPGNRISVEGKLDIDALTERPKGLAEDLKGTQPIILEMKFQVSNGALRLSCEKFLLAGKPLPAAVAAEVVRIVGAMQPENFDTSRPVPLPFGLSKLSTANGTVSGDTGK